MVESSDLIFKLTGVHADSHSSFHTSHLKIEGFLIILSSTWEVAVFLSEFDLN
jgi:hypothetical protein